MNNITIKKQTKFRLSVFSFRLNNFTLKQLTNGLALCYHKIKEEIVFKYF